MITFQPLLTKTNCTWIAEHRNSSIPQWCNRKKLQYREKKPWGKWRKHSVKPVLPFKRKFYLIEVIINEQKTIIRKYMAWEALFASIHLLLIF
jgi:hypothetical protein